MPNIPTSDRQQVRYYDYYGHLTYSEFLAWQAGSEVDSISQNGRGL